MEPSETLGDITRGETVAPGRRERNAPGRIGLLRDLKDRPENRNQTILPLPDACAPWPQKLMREK
jgi:hypothetical protein